MKLSFCILFSKLSKKKKGLNASNCIDTFVLLNPHLCTQLYELLE